MLREAELFIILSIQSKQMNNHYKVLEALLGLLSGI
jgi:hypothetical protein